MKRRCSSLFVFAEEDNELIGLQEDIAADAEDKLERPAAYHSFFRRGDERSPEEIAREIEERHKYTFITLKIFVLFSKSMKKTYFSFFLSLLFSSFSSFFCL